VTTKARDRAARNRTACAECFPPLWVLTKPKLRLHFAKPS
jgi:hypothetical protein